MVIKNNNRSKVKHSKLKRVKRTVKRSLKRRSFKNTKRKKINRRTNRKTKTKRMKGGMEAVTPVVVTQPTEVSLPVLESEQVKFKRLFNNLHRVSGSNMVRACETTTGVIVLLLGDPHTYDWRKEKTEGEYYDKDNICDSTNGWPSVKVEKHDTYKSFRTKDPPYGIKETDMENPELTATTADLVATCIETFPLSLEAFVEGSSWKLDKDYMRTGLHRTLLYNELYWLIKMNYTETEEPRPLLVHATDYRSRGEPINLLLTLLSGALSLGKNVKKNLLEEEPERWCLAVVEKDDFMAQTLPDWFDENVKLLSNGKETLYQMHVALCGNPTGVYLRDFLACITTFGCDPQYLTDDLPIPANFVMEDIEKATHLELRRVCRYNGYMDDTFEEEVDSLETKQAKIELLKRKIKEKNSSGNVLKMPVSQIYINLYSEQYNLAKKNGTTLLFGVFLNLFFQELSKEMGDISNFFYQTLGLYARERGAVSFDNQKLVLTQEGLHVYTTKIAKQLLKIKKSVFHKTFGFVANYLNYVGQFHPHTDIAIDNSFYGHDYMYDIYTVLRLARRCGYGENSEPLSPEAEPTLRGGSVAKAVFVIGGESRHPVSQPTVFHFFGSELRGVKAMRGHSTNAFKGLYAIGAIKGLGRGGASNGQIGTDCVELSGEI
jgi:hypothetical protein